MRYQTGCENGTNNNLFHSSERYTASACNSVMTSVIVSFDTPRNGWCGIVKSAMIRCQAECHVFIYKYAASPIYSFFTHCMWLSVVGSKACVIRQESGYVCAESIAAAKWIAIECGHASRQILRSSTHAISPWNVTVFLILTDKPREKRTWQAQFHRDFQKTAVVKSLSHFSVRHGPPP